MTKWPLSFFIALCKVCGYASIASCWVNTENVDLRIFFNLEQALSYFKNESNPLAEQILSAFQHSCCALHEPSLPKRRRPFIVIEGNHRKSRNVVGMRLAKMMRGRYLVHPAHCLQQISGELPKGTFFRRAFYVLSMYALAIEVKFHLSLGRAVVVNGYWWDMLTFALVQAFSPENIPDTTDPMFQFPKDLFEPDFTFFLNLPDNLYYRQVTTRNPISWKPRILKMYRKLQQRGDPVVVKELSGVLRPTTDFLYETMMVNLSGHRDVWFDSRRRINFDYRDD